MAAIFSHRQTDQSFYLALFVSLFSLVLIWPTYAQNKGGYAKRLHSFASLTQNSLASVPVLHDSLTRWARAIEDNDQVGAFDERNRIRGIMNQLGTKNIIPAADFSIAVGRKALLRGADAAAILAGENATLYAPDYPKSHFFLAKARFNQDRKNIKGFLLAVAEGVKASLANRLERQRLVALGLKYVLYALGAAFLITLFLLLMTHYKSMFTDIASILPSRPEGKWKLAVGVLVVTAPLAVGGLLLFALALPLFLLPYLKKSGMIVVGIFSAFVFLTPLAFDSMARGMIIGSADAYRSLYLLSKNTWDHETKAALEKERKANPANDSINFAIGLLNEMAGNKDAAIEAYDSILAKSPDNIRAIVNKGNTYFGAKKWEKAASIYKNAIKISPDTVEAHYNLSKAYTEMFQNKDSDAEYQKARSIHLKKTDSFRAMAGVNPEKKVIDFQITKDDLLLFERALNEKTRKLSESLWNSFFGLYTYDIYRKISLGFIVALGALYILWSRAIAHQTCFSCGVAFAPPIKLTSAEAKCNQCVAALSAKGGVSIAKKEKKRKEIRDYKDWRIRTAGTLDRLAPGLGRTFFQLPLAGLFLTFITSLIIIYGGLAFYDGIVTQKAQLAQVAQNHLLFFAVAAFYWIIMNTALKRDYY
ncbi:hypothetical protein MNBD_NITROSPINAE04-1170 [hydrothermal vent metagenome]|uniref:Uncharacterized protein n=1 Tax=hydrothermal vent metagenome TaxID=652676 RepID=A0A3B1BRC2_9ZZZZ